MEISVQIIRHGKTRGNLLKRYIGRINESLSNVGVLEVKSYKEHFTPHQMIFTSPMKRCVQTANILYSEHKPMIVDGLRECDFGEFEGKTYEELKYNEEYIAWIDSGGTSNLHKGEAIQDFKQRTIEAFDKIINHCEVNKISDIGIVCHGGSIMTILEKFANISKGFYDWQIENINGFDFIFNSEVGMAKNIKKIRGK